ncbi:hypothetical protein ACHAPT_013143 [Fusarium lateritium]
MVAAAGAGPEPIPQKSLTVERLAEAIRFCLTPEAAEAAAKIAAKMRAESGVKAAVASFHNHLPQDNLECDIVKGQPAISRRYCYLNGSKALKRMSQHNKVHNGSFGSEHIEFPKAVCEIYDWKSGVVFGAKAVVFGVVDGVGGLFILPYKGAKQQGAIGTVKGVGKGVAGLSIKLFTGM